MPSVDFPCFVLRRNMAACIKPDITDHPTQAKHEANSDDSKKKLFATMKYEINRLNSFKNKWPLNFINPEDLSEAGFFYLQTEDKVQCAFCLVIIYNWTVNDRPLKEHMRNSPRCPLLNSRDVGNVPLFRQNSLASELKPQINCSIVSTASYKPKHPRLADVKRRLMTYKEWPAVNLSPTYLSKCGLFYTGVADVVTCFFCGGALGNWEPGDDPLVEHEKFFPNCAFLALAKSALSSEPSPSVNPNMAACSNPVPLSKPSLLPISMWLEEDSRASEVIKQACEIFPKSLVLDVASKHFQETGRHFTGLPDLCEEILEYKTNSSSSKSQDCVSSWKSQDSAKVIEEMSPKVEITNDVKVETCATAARSRMDTLLCKICMDQEMGVVFQPCGHLVACLKCSREISNCPLCRMPISNIVRTYLS